MCLKKIEMVCIFPYRISKGAYDDFGINPETGKISLNRELDYDRRDSYSIEIIAVGKY